MSLKNLSVALSALVLCTSLTLAGGAPEPQVPCTRPLKHLNCQDLKDLQERKGCEVEQPVCDPVETIVEKEVLVPFPVTVIQEVPVPVEVIKTNIVTIPECAVCDYVKQWNIQAIGGERSFRGLQGRYKSFGIRAGEYDLGKEPTFGAARTQQSVLASTDGARRNDDNPVVVCHHGRTITVDNDAVPGHLRHGDTVGACSGNPPTDDCSDGVCRESCPQNCDEPPTCDDGVCREECPQNCDEPPTCSDGVCSEACPQNCDDDPPSCSDQVCREECPENCGTPDPRSTSTRRVTEAGKAYTIEGLYFIPLPNKCSNFSLYVGAGVTRRTEIGLLQEIETGNILKRDENNKYKATGTIGAEYRFPFSLVIGGTYDSSFGLGVTAGYSYRFK